MSTGATSTTADTYLEQLRSHLDDLPEGEVDEILVDVAGSLEESDDAARPRLDPAAYAEELRRAAGYGPTSAAGVSDEPRRAGSVPRVALRALGVSVVLSVVIGALAYAARPDSLLVLGLVALAPALTPALLGYLFVRGHDNVRSTPEAVWCRSRLDRLRGSLPPAVADLAPHAGPVWWVGRAVLAALLVATTVSQDLDLRTVAWLSVLFVAPSIWLGRATPHSRALTWFVIPLNAFAVGVGLAVLLGTNPSQNYYYSQAEPVGVVDSYASGASNIYPVDSQGTPLSGVYLFDQDGQPLGVDHEPCFDDLGNPIRQPDTTAPFPRPWVRNDPVTGECVEGEGMPFTAVIPRTVSAEPPTTSAEPRTPAPTTTTPSTPAPTTTGPTESPTPNSAPASTTPSLRPGGS